MSLRAARGFLGPSNSEIENSPGLKEVTNALDEFLAEPNTQAKISRFGAVLDLFDQFVTAKQTKSIQTFYIPFIANELLGFVQFVVHDVSLLTRLVTVLSHASACVNLSCEYQHLSVLIVGCFLAFATEKDVANVAGRLFLQLLSDKDTFSTFAFSGGFTVVFNSVFVDIKLKELADFVTDLFFVKLPAQLYQNCPYDPFFASAITAITEKNVFDGLRFEAGLFIAKFFAAVSFYNKQMSKYGESGLFKAFDELIGDRVDAYRPLIMSANDNLSPPPNCYVYQRLFRIYSVEPALQGAILDLVVSLCQGRHELIKSLNEKVPYELWFKKATRVEDGLLKLVGVLSDDIALLQPCMKPLIALMTIDKATKEYFDLLKAQMNRKVISAGDILNAGFLENVVSADDDVLVRLFTQSSGFLWLLSVLISMVKDQQKKDSIFAKVFGLVDKFERTKTFDTIGVTLLGKCPESRYIKMLMNAIDKVQQPQYVRIFQSLFMDLPKAARGFVKQGGVKWLLETDYITQDVYVDVLAATVYPRRFDEVEDYIKGLPEDHKLFRVSVPELEKIVYGMNTCTYRPIRVRSLAHLVRIPDYVDPFNAWMLANQYVDHQLAKGVDISDIPSIAAIANRYVPARRVDLLLAKPFELGRYCDMSYDHFPLFQLFPGPKSLVFRHEYECVSFWFRIKDKTLQRSTFIKVDGFSVAVEEGKVLVFIGNEKHCLDADPQQWNYVRLSVDSSLMSSQISVTIQDKNYTFQLKQKMKKFTFLSFSSTGNTLLFLGSSIRFYAKTPKKDTMFSKGPGFFSEMHNGSNEQTITPFYINHPNKEIYFEKPPTCVSVPYFGMPMHFISLRMLHRLVSILEKAQSQEEFSAMFQAMITINSITKYHPAQFWAKLVEVLKKCQQFLSKKMFLDALVSVSAQKEKEKILSSILFDSNMWRLVNNEILVECLFEHFSDVNWSQIENFELFMSTVIMENQENKAIVLTILRNHEKVPKLVKCILTILKTAPAIIKNSCTWESLEFREDIPVQSTILGALETYTVPETVDYVVSILPFEELKGLALVSTPDLQLKLLHFLSRITLLRPKYLMCDRPLLSVYASLSHKFEVWDDVFVLFRTHGSDLVPILMVLIWAAAICFVNSELHGPPSNEEHFRELMKRMVEAIDCCSQGLTTSLTQLDCLSVVLGWYPLVFHFLVLFQDFPDKSILKDSEFGQISISQFPEVQDPDWIGTEQVLKDLAFPAPKKPSLPGQFMLQLISEILHYNGFQVPFPTDYHARPIDEWLMGSPVVIFIAKIILSSSQQWFGNVMHSILFSFFFGQQQRKDPFAPIILHTILTTTVEDSTVPVSQLLAYTNLLAGLKLLTDYSLMILSDVFELSARLFSKESVVKFSASIHPILHMLFQSTPVTMYEQLFRVLTERAQLFVQIILSQRSLHCWLYMFLVPSINAQKYFDPFFDEFVKYLELPQADRTIIEEIRNHSLHSNEKALSMLEAMWKERSHDIQQGYQVLYHYAKITPPRFPVEVGALSNETARCKFMTTCRHYLNAHLFVHSLRFLTYTFSLLDERTQWAFVINRIRDESSDVSQYNPQAYHLSPSSFPFCAPTLFTPSPFKREPLARSQVIKIYRNNIKFLYSSTSNLRVNMLRLFVKVHAQQYGVPKIVIPCEILRYANPIKSVLFVYSSAFLILTFTQLTEAETDFVTNYAPNTQELHNFLESVFLGHWGHTTVFASKVVIRLPRIDVIHIHQLNENELNFWSLSSGSFIARMRKRNIVQLMHDVMSPGMPPTPMVYHIKTHEEARYKYISQQISAAQALCVFNCLSGRSFSDLNKYPIFPYVDNRDWAKTPFDSFPQRDTVKSLLANCVPFDAFGEPSLPTTTDLPAAFFYSANFWEKASLPVSSHEHIVQLRTLIESPEVMTWAAAAFNITGEIHRAERITRWVSDLDLTQLPQKLTFDGSGGTVYYSTGETLVKLPVLSVVPNHLPWMAVVLDRDMLCLSFINVKTNEVYFRKHSHLFLFASGISIAANGLLLAVDYKFGMTRVYRIFYKDNAPRMVRTCSIFGWNTKPKSIISGSDLVIASMCGPVLTLWNIFAATIHRVVKLDADIVCMAFDETVNSIWVMTQRKGVFMTVNGYILAEIEMTEIVTSIKVVRLPREEPRRSAILGTEDGSIYIVTPNYETRTVEMKKLPSPHTCAIKKVSLHSSNKTFVSISRDGLVCSWNSLGLAGPRLALVQIAHCCSCENKATLYCNSCNRGICADCAEGAKPHVVCRDCRINHC